MDFLPNRMIEQDEDDEADFKLFFYSYQLLDKPPLFLRYTTKLGIEKMRSIIFQNRKSSGVTVTQPPGCGGKNQ
jgi:hypothetical protein